MFLCVMFVWASSAMAGGYPWNGNAAPFNFLFGNHIDQFEQSKLLGNGDIQGFLYIKFTGGSVQGAPAAVHGQDSVGWIIYGVPMKAKLVAGPPMQMPIWCVNAADLPREQGFSHFHWLGNPQCGMDLVVGQTYTGFLLKLTAIDTFFFTMNMSGGTCGDMSGDMGGNMGGNMGGGTLVTPGIDDYSHYNIVTNCN